MLGLFKAVGGYLRLLSFIRKVFEWIWGVLMADFGSVWCLFECRLIWCSLRVLQVTA